MRGIAGAELVGSPDGRGTGYQDTARRPKRPILLSGLVPDWTPPPQQRVFVEPETLPGWLEAFVDISPISHLVTAARGLMNGTVAGLELTVSLGTAALLGLDALSERPPVPACAAGAPRPSSIGVKLGRAARCRRAAVPIGPMSRVVFAIGVSSVARFDPARTVGRGRAAW
jgi:hypothetical protein